MIHGFPSRIGRRLPLAVASALLASASLIVATGPAAAQPAASASAAAPRDLLRAMSDYMASQQRL